MSVEILLRKYGRVEWSFEASSGDPACKLIGGPIIDEISGNTLTCSWLYWGTGETEIAAMEDVIRQLRDELQRMIMYVELA